MDMTVDGGWRCRINICGCWLCAVQTSRGNLYKRVLACQGVSMECTRFYRDSGPGLTSQSSRDEARAWEEEKEKK